MGVALLVVLAVVISTIFGIGTISGGMAAQEAGSHGDSAAFPGPVTTPTVSPGGTNLLTNPPAPPRWTRPQLDPATQTWSPPLWPWDALPQLAATGDEAWATLQSPDLTDLLVPAPMNCGLPLTVDDMDAYEVAVRQQWTCVHEAWRPIFEGLGLQTEEPEIRFYDGAEGISACGRAVAPAFYCPRGKGTAHFGRDDMEVAGYWDMSIKDTVGHEYVHHIQNVAGIMDAMAGIAYTSDLDRRLELQASCLSSAMTAQTNTVDLDERRWDEWHDNVHESLPDEEHGSIASLQYWSFRGLYATTVGECNTWAVDPERVS